MSVQAITWALAQNVKPSGRKFTLVALANYSDGEGVCFPGQKKLAADTGLSERSVWKYLRNLEDEGYISRSHRQRSDGSRTSDEYRLNIQLAPVATRPDIQLASEVNPTRAPCEAILEPSEEPLGSTPPSVPPMPETISVRNQKAASNEPTTKGASQNGSRIDPNWNPTAQHFVLGSELGFDEGGVRAESDKFRDYWTAESGQRARKLDWDATFRNWLRKATEFVGRGPGPPGQRQAGSGGRGDTGVVAALRELQNRRENL